MRTPATAIAWEFHYRHRWALVTLAIYLLIFGLLKPLFLDPGYAVRFDPPDGFAAFGVTPFSITFFYLVSVFTFGLAGDVAARQSIYPARMFTLPISTAKLAGLPMLYGTISMMALWSIAVLLARWPWNVHLALAWPGVLGAVTLAWLQVFMWMPYGFRGLRVAFAVIVMTTLNTVVLVAIEKKLSELALIGFLAPQLPIAYLCACAVVARARRGEVPDWSFSFGRSGAVADARRRPHFRSAAAAQFWFEWRRHGRSLPVLVAIVVPFLLATLFISGFGSESFVFKVLISVLLTPMVMAGFAAASVSKANPFGRDAYGITPFTATRPLTSAQLVGAKLRMAIWSTGAAWIVVFVAIPIGFTWSGADLVLTDRWHSLVAHAGLSRAAAVATLLLGGLVASTWTMLVGTMYVGLTGREWIVKTIAMVTVVTVTAAFLFLEWLTRHAGALRWLWDWWPLLMAVLVVAKIAAAAWTAFRLSQRNLIGDRTLIIGAVSWVLVVLALHSLLIWLVDTPIIPSYVLALMAILAVPLARVSAAPLAFDWNRHR